MIPPSALMAMVLLAFLAAPTLAQGQSEACPPPEAAADQAAIKQDFRKRQDALRKSFSDQRFALTLERRDAVDRREGEIFAVWKARDHQALDAYERERDAKIAMRRKAAEVEDWDLVAQLTEQLRQRLKGFREYRETLWREMRAKQQRETEDIRASYDRSLAKLADAYADALDKLRAEQEAAQEGLRRDVSCPEEAADLSNEADGGARQDERGERS